MKNLRITNPCPVYLSKDRLSGNGFDCKGCNKKVIDFSNMSDEELIKNLKPNVCGIFSPEQMPSQQSYKGLKRMAFYSLMLFSLLGFNVKPMTASTAGDTSKQKEESLYVKKGKELRIQKREYRQQEKDKKKRKRNKIFRKKRKFKPLGCIEF